MGTKEMKTGTLKELNVQAGDVVRWPDGPPQGPITVISAEVSTEDAFAGQVRAELSGYGWGIFDGEIFTIISRAQEAPASLPSTPDLPYGHVTLSDGRTVDLTANRVRCDLMDPEELQAMKDHGGPYEFWCGSEWHNLPFVPSWTKEYTYRVAPKPVVETLVIHGDPKIGSWGRTQHEWDTHRITLTIQDGDIIDTKTEKL